MGIQVIYTTDKGENIRALLCRESHNNNDAGRNPLMETDFNALLNDITQDAFDQGRQFERMQVK